MFENYSKRRSGSDISDGKRTEDRGGGKGHYDTLSASVVKPFPKR